MVVSLSFRTPSPSSVRAPRGLEPRGNISHEKMSFVQSGDETGSASCVSAAGAPIVPFEQAHRREAGRTGVLVCTSSRRYEGREMVEPRAWGNFMIRSQRVVEEVVMPRPAASRAPRLADVDRPGAVRRLNTCGMKISLTRSISFHIKRWQNKQARFRQSSV